MRKAGTEGVTCRHIRYVLDSLLAALCKALSCSSQGTLRCVHETVACPALLCITVYRCSCSLQPSCLLTPVLRAPLCTGVLGSPSPAQCLLGERAAQLQGRRSQELWRVCAVELLIISTVCGHPAQGCGAQPSPHPAGGLSVTSSELTQQQGPVFSTPSVSQRGLSGGILVMHGRGHSFRTPE